MEYHNRYSQLQSECTVTKFIANLENSREERAQAENPKLIKLNKVSKEITETPLKEVGKKQLKNESSN